MQKPAKGLLIFLWIFAGLALLGTLNPTNLTYEVKGKFDSSKDFSITMTGCQFKPKLEYIGIKEVFKEQTEDVTIIGAVVSNRVDCRSDKKNSIYWVRSLDSLTRQ